MPAKTQILHEGKLYYSLVAAARLVGTTTTGLKKIIGAEGLEHCNLRVNGPLWVNAQDIESYLRRRDKNK
jgi:hypothetical protein